MKLPLLWWHYKSGKNFSAKRLRSQSFRKPFVIDSKKLQSHLKTCTEELEPWNVLRVNRIVFFRELHSIIGVLHNPSNRFRAQ